MFSVEVATDAYKPDPRHQQAFVRDCLYGVQCRWSHEPIAINGVPVYPGQAVTLEQIKVQVRSIGRNGVRQFSDDEVLICVGQVPKDDILILILRAAIAEELLGQASLHTHYGIFMELDSGQFWVLYPDVEA